MTQSAAKFHHSSIIKTTNGHWHAKVTYLADKTIGVKRGPLSTSAECSALIPEMVAELRELVAKSGKALVTPVNAVAAAIPAAAKATIHAAPATGPVWTVRGVSRPMGREGPGLKCDLYMSGLKVAEMRDYGDGAMCNLNWLGPRDVEVSGFGYDDKPRTWKGSLAEAKFEEFLKTLPKIPADPKRGLPEMRMSDEIWIEQEANKIHGQARAERLLKSHVMGTENGKVYQWKVKPDTVGGAKGLRERVAAKNPGVRFITNATELASLINA